jgi:ribonucleoside-diphosphate reductase alpha chain
MGFQDCLHLLHMPYASDAAMAFADTSMEAVCYFAYQASTEMAEERGRYASYKGSLWDRGILPQDTLKLLRDERGGYVDIDESSTMNWDVLRSRIRIHGMRNSNCVAIAPTATISNIVGVGASIEPEYQNIYVKSNLSGEFTVVTKSCRRAEKLNLWDEMMVAISSTSTARSSEDHIPAELHRLRHAFEVEQVDHRNRARGGRNRSIGRGPQQHYMAGASGEARRHVGWRGCAVSRPRTTCTLAARRRKSRRARGERTGGRGSGMSAAAKRGWRRSRRTEFFVRLIRRASRASKHAAVTLRTRTEGKR